MPTLPITLDSFQRGQGSESPSQMRQGDDQRVKWMICNRDFWVETMYHDKVTDRVSLLQKILICWPEGSTRWDTKGGGLTLKLTLIDTRGRQRCAHGVLSRKLYLAAGIVMFSC